MKIVRKLSAELQAIEINTEALAKYYSTILVFHPKIGDWVVYDGTDDTVHYTKEEFNKDFIYIRDED